MQKHESLEWMDLVDDFMLCGKSIMMCEREIQRGFYKKTKVSWWSEMGLILLTVTIVFSVGATEVEKLHKSPRGAQNPLLT